MKHFAWNDLRDIVTVQGRTWEHEDNLYFNWSSSGFTVRFRGSALLAEFSAQSSEEYDGIPGDPNTPHRTVWPWISVFVDDNDQPCRTFELTNKSTKYLIYSGTDEQEHTVRVVKLTENIKTGLSLHSFDVDGEILMPVVEPIKSVLNLLETQSPADSVSAHLRKTGFITLRKKMFGWHMVLQQHAALEWIGK